MKGESMNIENMVDAKKLSRLFKVNVMTIYRWANCNKIKGVKVGGKWYFDKDTCWIERPGN